MFYVKIPDAPYASLDDLYQSMIDFNNQVPSMDIPTRDEFKTMLLNPKNTVKISRYCGLFYVNDVLDMLRIDANYDLKMHAYRESDDLPHYHHAIFMKKIADINERDWSKHVIHYYAFDVVGRDYVETSKMAQQVARENVVDGLTSLTSVYDNFDVLKHNQCHDLEKYHLIEDYDVFKDIKGVTAQLVSLDRNN